MEDFFTAREFAALVGLKLETIHMQSHQGRLPVKAKKLGKRLVFLKTDVHVYLNSLEEIPANRRVLEKSNIATAKKQRIRVP